jgi:pimeloyl-ACP methyl ester carboxylesterase
VKGDFSMDAPTFVGGTGEPLVLLHGATMSWRVWEPLLPSLTERHRVLAPTLPAHAGHPASKAVLTLDDLVDAVESTMDREDVTSAHVAGNSLGGLVAMELARRGRARSVYAISPAGGWTPDGGTRIANSVAAQQRAVRLIRHAIPVAMRAAWLRRLAFRDVAVRGDKLTPDAATRSLLTTADSTLFEHLSAVVVARSYGDLGVPIRIAWPEDDRIIPLDPHGKGWHALIPGASWTDLGRVGHVPMIDEPHLVARLLLDWLSASEGADLHRAH